LRFAIAICDCDVAEATVATRGAVPGHLLVPVDPESDSMVFDLPVAAIEWLTGWRYDASDPVLDEARHAPVVGLSGETATDALPRD
jgi:hypothetical protein